MDTVLRKSITTQARHGVLFAVFGTVCDHDETPKALRSAESISHWFAIYYSKCLKQWPVRASGLHKGEVFE